MPVSRDEGVVRRALGSVLAQDFADFEVLIGDESGLAEPAVAGYDDPRVHYHRNPERLGFTENHRALLDRAAGRYMAVLHDDDWWEPQYLSSLVGVLDADPDIGMACAGTLVDRGDTSEEWPVAISAGRHDDAVEVLLREEWFLLPVSTVWRREVWQGPAREWPELCCADLQLFMSAADAGWGLYYLARPLAHWVQHSEQSGAWRGSDHGLGVADDVLAFWNGWLEGRPDAQIEMAARQRARWHLRRARALVLSGRRSEAHVALRQAAELRRAAALDASELPGMSLLTMAAWMPTGAVRAGVRLKRSPLMRPFERRMTLITPRRSSISP